ncbi:type IV pilin protein [Candidatus Avelusimicrobium caledoniensis]|uniref:type IV pilin protein n=1 Tax=Candidatus Avelusimicrobium caledoniensis TaxID=3416220 RepID=UPI003D0F8DA5
MKNINKNLSFPRFVVGNLPLSKSLLKEEKQRFFNGKVEDPRQKHSGMTPNFNNSAFTLIELLVVVLIIGILAAVALPQYQKAVEKSRAAQVLPLLKSVYNAAEAYYLANGKAASSFDDLSVDIPWTGTRKWYDNYASPVKSNNDWSLQLYFDAAKKEPAISIGRLTGKYKGGGFMIYLQSAVNGLPKATPVCVERRTDGANFTEPDGSYCKNIMKGTLKSTHSTMRWYTLP